jgi:dienelactone hydrolase
MSSHPLPLLTFRDQHGDSLISTSRQWPPKRQDILRRLEALVADRERMIPPLDPQVLLQDDQGDYLEQQVQYGVELGETCGGTLLLPKPLSHRQPAVLCCPYDGPTTAATVARELAKRGFVVLTPHERKHPLAKALWDHQRGLDLLCHLDAVDSDRLAAIGQGRGGLNALLLAAYDHRVKAIAAACAYEPREPGRMELWEGHLGTGQPPVFAWVEVLALIAPRAFHYTYASHDEALPAAGGVEDDMIELGRLYDLLGCRDKFSTFVSPEGHGYPTAARREAYAVLKRVLKDRR